MVTPCLVQRHLKLDEKLPVMSQDDDLSSGVTQREVPEPGTVIRDVVEVKAGNRIVENQDRLLARFELGKEQSESVNPLFAFAQHSFDVFAPIFGKTVTEAPLPLRSKLTPNEAMPFSVRALYSESRRDSKSVTTSSS